MGEEGEGKREGKGKDDLHPTLFLGPGSTPTVFICNTPMLLTLELRRLHADLL